MPRKRRSVEEIIRVVREVDLGTPIGEICKTHGVSNVTLNRWRKQYGGMGVEVAQAVAASGSRESALEGIGRSPGACDRGLKADAKKNGTGLSGVFRALFAKLRGGLSQRLFCAASKIPRASLRYRARERSEFDHEVRAETVKLAWQYPDWGSPIVTALLRRLGYPVNHKRIESIWKQEELQCPRKKPRARRQGTPWQRDLVATRPNEVWCYDFPFERTKRGRKLKILAVLDEYTRENLSIHVGDRIDSQGVKEILEGLFAERGAPRYIRSDNGSEFSANWLQEWLRAKGTTPVYIEPASPWQNGFIESFNGTFRRECLDRESFGSKEELEVVSAWYRGLYNEIRPHSALGYRPPREFARQNSGSKC